MHVYSKLEFPGTAIQLKGVKVIAPLSRDPISGTGMKFIRCFYGVRYETADVRSVRAAPAI